MFKKKISFLFLFVLGGFVFILFSQNDNSHKKKRQIPDNHECLKCHGHLSYTALSKDSTQKKKMLMNPERRIDSVQYAHATHGSFKCTDCHDEGYSKYPHDADLKFSQMMVCMDCHGGNKKFAQYNFETIEQEALKSVHSKSIKGFTCWQCHNPHTYVNTYYKSRKDISQSKAIEVCNTACKECHSNPDKFGMLSDKKMKDIAGIHEFLPNYELHFKNVRCTDCHAVIRDSIASNHNIAPVSNAIKNCAECHSMNSRLMTTLYKYTAKSERNKYGFINAAIMNNAYVIGANRNSFLNIVSISILIVVIIAVAVHYSILVYSRKNQNKNG